MRQVKYLFINIIIGALRLPGAVARVGRGRGTFATCHATKIPSLRNGHSPRLACPNRRQPQQRGNVVYRLSRRQLIAGVGASALIPSTSRTFENPRAMARGVVFEDRHGDGHRRPGSPGILI
jgi:hypothetical protein